MTTVENAVVNHVRLGSGSVVHKTVDSNPDLVVEEAIQRAEEAAMEDEEIQSDDDDHPMTEAIENQMLTAALVNSFADAGPRRESASTEDSSGTTGAGRYGLRKRPRPSETSQASEDKVGNAENVIQETPSILQAPSENGTVTKDVAKPTIMMKIEQEPIPASAAEIKEDIPELPGEAVLEETTEFRIEQGDFSMSHAGGSSGSASGTPPASVLPVLPAKADPTTVMQEIPPFEKTMPPPLNQVPTPAKIEVNDIKVQPLATALPSLPSLKQQPCKPKVAPANTRGRLPKSTPTTTVVIPAPLAKARPPKQKKSPKAASSPKKRKSPPPASAPKGYLPSSGAVPNPLAASYHSTLLLPCPPPPVASTANLSREAVPCPLSSVPCPLPPATFQRRTEEAPLPPQPERKVTISEPPVTTRSRVFSVDLDPSTFDFPEFGADSESDKVEHVDSANASDLAVFQRERAFSFEFFNFAGDELLPAAPVSEDTADHQLPDPAISGFMGHSDMEPIRQRPRGDSIIFDPVSFQDGGIHEKNALLKARAASIGSAADALLLENKFSTANTGITGSSLPQPVSTPSHVPSSVLPHSSSQAVPALDNPSTDQSATLPSALGIPAVNGTSPATFQLELLNKDGRIGIYLPEARRARIARFHAKRKMRIWRKRIKYDCRKKLADSRPRIKGRFVKRSDMDDE